MAVRAPRRESCGNLGQPCCRPEVKAGILPGNVQVNDTKHPMISLLEAAERTGKTKPTILKAIKRGRISATKNDVGEWQIDPAELHRVYPPVNDDEDPRTSQGTTGLTVEAEVLRRENALLREQLDDVRQDRDHWRVQAERATILLTDQRQKPAAAPDARRGFWRWFLRDGGSA